MPDIYPVLKTGTRLFFGADPEIFLELNGHVVGSERTIPTQGLSRIMDTGSNHHEGEGKIAVIQDGVQVELNIPPTNCRQYVLYEIREAFKLLQTHLALDPTRAFTVSFRQVVDVDKQELASLTPVNRQLGCMPSFNWYDSGASISVDPMTYTKRSAGGHIHLGLPEHLMSERERLPPLLDVLLGNTSVLIDRDPSAAERRKVYGRAGEFRTPRHGLEYRTLSNFWLHASPLTSLVFGLARLAVYVLDTSVSDGGWPADETLLSMVDMGQVQKAINTNDMALARENFKAVSAFLTRHHPTTSSMLNNETGLDGSNLAKFETFVNGVEAKGLTHWFPNNPLTHWSTTSWTQDGWESFLMSKV